MSLLFGNLSFQLVFGITCSLSRSLFLCLVQLIRCHEHICVRRLVLRHLLLCLVNRRERRRVVFLMLRNLCLKGCLFGFMHSLQCILRGLNLSRMLER